ncbi:MAG: hypothetical protein JF615_02970 [Asticcacaulis sp.]|nr:hypothetical protein [Asticcacaulis sp.]
MKLAAAILAGLVMTGAVHAATPPISKIDSRTLPPREVADRLAQQMVDLFVLKERKLEPRGYPPEHPLSSLWYYTRFRSSDVTGVCTRNAVIFRFDDTDRDADADTEQRVEGVDADSEYVVLPSLTADAGRTNISVGTMSQRQAQRKACETLGDDAATIGAPSAGAAADGLFILDRVIADANSASPQITINCDPKELFIDQKTCRDPLAGLGRASFGEISDCGVSEIDGLACWMFGNAMTSLQVYVDDKQVPRRALLRQWIVISDYRTD